MISSDLLADWVVGSKDHIGRMCIPDLSCCIDIKDELRVNFEFRKRFLVAHKEKDPLAVHTLAIGMLNAAELSIGEKLSIDGNYNSTIN